jgi:hypothetical protein
MPTTRSAIASVDNQPSPRNHPLTVNHDVRPRSQHDQKITVIGGVLPLMTALQWSAWIGIGVKLSPIPTSVATPRVGCKKKLPAAIG